MRYIVDFELIYCLLLINHGLMAIVFRRVYDTDIVHY